MREISICYLLHFTYSIHTVLSFMLFHPTFFHEPSIDVTSDTVSHDRLGPHEDDTENTCDDGRIHRCDDKRVICDIGAYTFENA